VTAAVQVRPVADAKDLAAFIQFPFDLHRNEPHWVPPLVMERQDFLNPKKNPLYEYAQVELFLAFRDGQVVGTVAAVRNDRYGQFHPEETHVGFFGLYECVPDQAVADALLAAASAWLKAQGFTLARGPVNLTTNDVVGLLVDGFGEDNTIMMPYNPPYYGGQMEAAGFVRMEALDIVYS